MISLISIILSFFFFFDKYQVFCYELQNTRIHWLHSPFIIILFFTRFILSCYCCFLAQHCRYIVLHYRSYFITSFTIFHSCLYLNTLRWRFWSHSIIISIVTFFVYSLKNGFICFFFDKSGWRTKFYYCPIFSVGERVNVSQADTS